MSHVTELTSDLAFWIAGLLREMLTDAPPPNQRNTAEWLLEQLDAASSAERGGGGLGSSSGDPTFLDSLVEQDSSDLEGPAAGPA